jgi:hypothetical protein
MDNPLFSATALADIIREICNTHEVPVNAVVLFESPATRKAREQSDRDFLIITKKPIVHSLKRKITMDIRKKVLLHLMLTWIYLYYPGMRFLRVKQIPGESHTTHSEMGW